MGRGRIRKELTNQTFNRLTVKEYVGPTEAGQSLYRCVCSCGNETVSQAGNLKSGQVKSCGCLRRELAADIGRKSGPQNIKTNRQSNEAHSMSMTTHGLSDSPTYKSWSSMLSRANNRDGNHPAYENVFVCESWMTFEGFYASMGERPEGTTLSRFGDVGNYEPGNCAWHTDDQQQAEARKKIFAAHAA